MLSSAWLSMFIFGFRWINMALFTLLINNIIAYSIKKLLSTQILIVGALNIHLGEENNAKVSQSVLHKEV